MNKRQYTPLRKNIGIAVQMVLTIIFVISVYLLGALASKNVLNTSDIWNPNFLESGCYRELFQERIDALISFLQLRGKFETDGAYNPDKVVNTLRYAKDGTILADAEVNAVLILAQDEEGNYTYNESIAEEFREESKNSQEDIQLELSNYRLSDLVTWAKEGYTKTGSKIEETFLPIEGMGIAEAVDQGLITNVQARNLYVQLETTLSTTGKRRSCTKKD